MPSGSVTTKSKHRSMRVFITGHRGYIGSTLFRLMKEVSFISRVEGYDIIDGNDILNTNILINRMKNFRPDVVIHLAALSSVAACNGNTSRAILYNAIGTRNVLAAMQKSGCKNIIYAGTSSVYGNSSRKELPYTEDSPVEPCSPYGISKLLGECVIFNHYHNRNAPGNYLIFRMFNVVGTSSYPDIDRNSNPGYDRLFSALESGHVTIYGTDYPTYDGTCQRDYVSLKDVCIAFLNGLEVMSNGDKIQEIINICTGRPCSVERIINTWNSITKSSSQLIKTNNSTKLLPKVERSYGPRREGDPAIVYGSNEKANEVLNWKPIRKIEDIIRDLAHDKNL